MPLTAWTSRAAPWLALALAGLTLLLVVRYVDLSPRVEGDFFFAEDDPQMEATRAVARDFPSGSQLILRVQGGGDLSRRSPSYLERVAELTRDLLFVPGVQSGYSVATESVASPLFSRILLTPDSSATNVILLLDDTDPEVLLPGVEEVVDRYRAPELDIAISGVPAIVEMIRRSLFRDLVVFSAAAVLVFAGLIGLVYRDPAIVVGTLATCLTSVSVTLLLVQGMGVGIGLLTANLITIVFVLTLSHVVFLTGNWRRLAAEDAGSSTPGSVLHEAVLRTREGSFWSMATTLLGFASLLVATARPLRELGVAGIVGSATALVVAYAVYPTFLGRWARTTRIGGPATGPSVPGRMLAPAIVGLVVVVAGAGIRGLDTDPGLLSYFAEGSELRDGLEQIDEDGGSSTLDIIVSDPRGVPIASPEVFPRLEALQSALESDPSVGVVLSPTVLIEHARTVPLARFLPVATLLDIASGDALDNVALGYVTEDRVLARFSLRMREGLEEPRDIATARLRATVEEAGLRPVAIAGLYDLQAELGTLIASSLRIGIGGLLLLFFGVALIVSRSLRVAALMWLCLAGIPVVILGAFGHLRIAMDIITSPAANIALAIGADSMIHLVVRSRMLRDSGDDQPWENAVVQIGRPVIRASVIIVAGFGIFALSGFPPTRRFGFAVIIGTVAACVMALTVLPRLAPWLGGGSLSGRRADSPIPGEAA